MNVNDPYSIPEYRFPAGTIKVFDICHAFSRVAGQHAKFLGISDDFITDRETGWIILSFSLRLLDSKPIVGSVQLETWVAAIEGASLVREFRVVANNADQSTYVVAEGAQGFIPFDRISRRPILLAKEKRDELSGEGRKFSFTLIPVRRKAKNLIPLNEPERTFEVKVTPTDVDANGHVNNAKYFEWISEAIDRPSATPCEISVEYLQEAKLEDRIEIRQWWTEPRRKFFSFYDKTTGTLSAIVRSATLQ